MELPEKSKTNNYPINLLDNKQSLYGTIYSLELVELKMLKTYTKANLANSFITSFKPYRYFDTMCLINRY